ncbi:carbohydrate ABC transporter permease [Ruania alba]|nr:sugar ABC transporter permease [Ruania alba]
MATVLIAPAMAAFSLFVLVPAGAGLLLAFFDWNLFGTPEFVGAENIFRLFGDDEMWQSLAVTGIFVVLGVAPTTLLGFVLAVVANSQLPGVAAFRVFYFAPMIASTAVAAVIWVSLYNGRSGLINAALGAFGIQGPNWLSDPTWARPALVVILIWNALPLVIILYLAGLQRVPADIYSAAALDGVGKWRMIWSMTWPNVAGTTALVLILQGIGFVSGTFELALLMTDGGPLRTTQSLALYAYQAAFTDGDIGYASALSMFQLFLLGSIVLVVRYLMQKRKESR